MQAIVIVVALAGFAVAAIGVASVRSDIQLILAAVGFFSGVILLAIAYVLGRLDKTWNFLIDIDERLPPPGK